MSDDEPPGGRPLSPGAARRTLGDALRQLREAVGLTLAQAGAQLERSAATISRYEGAKYIPRIVEITALLDFYQSRNAQIVTPAARERILWLVAESRKKQRLDAIRSQARDFIAQHVFDYMELEADASEIRTYDPDLVPGLLQTRDYALMLARLYLPGGTAVDHERFAEFRMVRQGGVLGRENPPRFSVVVNEAALHRRPGSAEIQRAQLQALVDAIRDPRPTVDIRVVPIDVVNPAVVGGPFVILAFPTDSVDNDRIYLETRSGGYYLKSAADLELYNSYFESLREVCLRRAHPQISSNPFGTPCPRMPRGTARRATSRQAHDRRAGDCADDCADARAFDHWTGPRDHLRLTVDRTGRFTLTEVTHCAG